MHFYENHEKANQQWIITQEGVIKSKVTGLVLEILGASQELFAPVVLAPIKGANGDLSQQWEFIPVTDSSSQPVTEPDSTPVGGRYYSIIAKHSGKVLDVKDGSTENLAAIIQYDNARSNNQKWLLTKAEDGYFYIASKQSNKVLDVPGSSQENLVNIIQYDKV